MLPGIITSFPSAPSVCRQIIQNLLKEGYLLQARKKKEDAFKKRWIQLKGNKLYSYKEKESKQLEIIDLESCKNVLESNNDENQNEFTLIFNEKQQRSFIALSDAEMNEWITEIRKVLKPQKQQRKPKKSIVTLTKEDNFKVYIAVDFGTDGCGLAFALKDQNDVTIYDRWKRKKKNIMFKTKTQILLNDQNKFVKFGDGAKKTYIGLDAESKKYKMFERFKMALYEKNTDEKQLVDIASQLVDVNGNKCASEIIFVAAFEHLKGAARKHLKKITQEQPNDDEIQWIITVPSIWGDRAKNKMFKWVVKAGLVKADIENQCKIVYEPDCAALAIQKEILRLQPVEDKLTLLLKENKLYNDLHEKLYANNMDFETLQNLQNDEINEFCQELEFTVKEKLKLRKLMKIINNKLSDNNDEKTDLYESHDEKKQKEINTVRFRKGEKYVLVDAGGGTVDVSCHEIMGKLIIREVHHPTGGPWGSTFIDDKYEQLLETIFSKEWMDEFKKEQANVYVEIIENFQQAKCSFYQNGDEKRHGCELPDDFIGFLEERCESPLSPEQKVNDTAGKSKDFVLNDNMLMINVTIWKSLFDSMLNQIIWHVDKLLKLDSLNGCKYLCLVGGFSCSKYFQLRMQNNFGRQSKHKLQLIIPEKPLLAVVEGAAYFGLCKNYVKARRLQKTYGHIVLDSIENCKEKGMSDEWIENHQQNGSVERVEVLAHKNQQIQMNQEIQSETFGHPNSDTTITIFCFERQNPLYPTDGVPIGKITISPKQFADENRTILMRFNFSDTTIAVNCYPKNNKNAKQRVDLEYV